MKSRFGIDAPYVIISLGLAGILSLFLAVFLRTLLPGIWGNVFFVCLLIEGGYFGLSALWMIYSSLKGKGIVLNRMISDMSLKGDEVLLDLGCGQGWFLTKVGKDLPKGMAIGIDIWKKGDLSGNSHERTIANITRKHLSDRVKIKSCDMRHLDIEDHQVDWVTASLAIHNIKEKKGRKIALQEINRVLKPGGKVSILDFQKIQESETFFRDELGWSDVFVSSKKWQMFPPVRILTAQKPYPP